MTRKQSLDKLRKWVHQQPWYKPKIEDGDVRARVAERLKTNK